MVCILCDYSISHQLPVLSHLPHLTAHINQCAAIKKVAAIRDRATLI